MAWTDSLDPDKMIAAAFKLFLAVFVFTCAIQLLCSVFSRLSSFDIAVVLVTWFLLNIAIFRIGNRSVRR